MMKCSTAHKMISDRIDNPLTAEQNDRLEAHLKSCRNCPQVASEMNQVVAQAAGLEILEPSADPWPSIKKQVTAEVYEPSLWERTLAFFSTIRHPVPAPAIVCFAVVMLTVVTMVTVGRLQPDAVHNGGDPLETAMTAKDIRAIESKYLKAIDILSREIRNRQPMIPPDLAAVFERNLKIVDASIVSLKSTVEGHHAGTTVGTYLFTCYQKKIEILNQIRETIQRIG